MSCCPSPSSRAPAPAPAPAPALEDENLLQEILLRLPPQPSSLPRASLVCKRWRSTLSDPRFLRRYRKHHRDPPLLGFFAGHVGVEPVFTAVLDSPDRIPPARFSAHRPGGDRWQFMGCRHGLAVLINDHDCEVVVWDPLTGQQRRVPFPPGLYNTETRGIGWRWHAAVLCAADAEDGHVHGDCLWSPFKLVLARGGCSQALACLYDSVPGAWGNIVSTATTHVIHPIRPSVLVGNALYWLFSDGGMLAFNLEAQTLGVVEKPGNAHCTWCWSCQPLRTDGGSGLGLAVISKLSIQLWERKSNCNGVVGWVLMHKTIQLEGMLFPREMPRDDSRVLLVGYDEDTNVLVLSTRIGRFMLQLESMQITKISERMENGNRLMEFYPYTNFYTPGRVIAGGDGGAENVNKYLDFSWVCRDTVMLCCGFFCFCMLSLLMWLMLKPMPYVVSRFFRLA